MFVSTFFYESSVLDTTKNVVRSCESIRTDGAIIQDSRSSPWNQLFVRFSEASVQYHQLVFPCNFDQQVSVEDLSVFFPFFPRTRLICRICGGHAVARWSHQGTYFWYVLLGSWYVRQLHKENDALVRWSTFFRCIEFVELDWSV